MSAGWKKSQAGRKASAKITATDKKNMFVKLSEKETEVFVMETF
jgi:hypothetical protein